MTIKKSYLSQAMMNELADARLKAWSIVAVGTAHGKRFPDYICPVGAFQRGSKYKEMLQAVAPLLLKMLHLKPIHFNDVADVAPFPTSYTNNATHPGSSLPDEGRPVHPSFTEVGSRLLKASQAYSSLLKPK